MLPAAVKPVDRKRLALLTTLFLLPSLTGQFVAQAIPAFMRMAGHGEAMIGLMFLVGLPFMLSFVWAPLVDRYGSARLGQRRGWMIGGQIAGLVAFSVFLFVDPAGHPFGLIAVGAVLMACIGTQIAAMSGWMLDLLPAQDHAIGSAIFAASGSAGGLVLGFGVLFLFGDLGWQACVLVVLSIGVAGALLMARLPMDRAQAPPRRTKRPSIWASLAVLRRPGVVPTFLLVQLMDMTITITFIFKPILQVDAGMSLSEIGLIGVIGNNAVGIVAAMAAAPVVRRIGAWRTFALMAAGALAMNGVLVWSLQDGVSRQAAILFVLASGVIGAVGYTAGRALFMGLCAKGHYAGDFMTLLSLDSAAALLMAMIGSLIASRFGIPAVFAAAAIAAAIALMVALIVAARRLGMAPHSDPDTLSTGPHS